MKKNTDTSSISLITDYDGDIKNLFDVKIPNIMPILPLRNMVLFPGIIIPVVIERPFSLKAISMAQSTDSFIGVICQKDAFEEFPDKNDLYSIGTAAKIMRILEAVAEDNLALSRICTNCLRKSSTRMTRTCRSSRMNAGKSCRRLSD